MRILPWGVALILIVAGGGSRAFGQGPFTYKPILDLGQRFVNIQGNRVNVWGQKMGVMVN